MNVGGGISIKSGIWDGRELKEVGAGYGN